MLAEDEVGRPLTDAGGGHDLVGRRILDHAVLVDTAFVGEGVGSDNGLVRLDRHPGDPAHHPAGTGYLTSVDPGRKRHDIAPDVQRHRNLLYCRVSGALADAVDCRLDLPRTGHDRGKRVGDGEAKVIVAMGRKHRFARVRHARDDVAKHRAIRFGRSIADGVGQVDRRRSGPDRDLDGSAQEVRVGSRRVFCRPLDIGTQVARMRDRPLDRVEHRFRRQVELDAHVERRRRDERVDARAAGTLYSRPRPVDVADRGAREAGDRRALALARDLPNRGEITLRCDREPGFDDVDPQRLELRRNAKLLFQVHRAPRRLLAIAKRRVENSNSTGHSPPLRNPAIIH